MRNFKEEMMELNGALRVEMESVTAFTDPGLKDLGTCLKWH